MRFTTRKTSVQIPQKTLLAIETDAQNIWSECLPINHEIR